MPPPGPRAVAFDLLLRWSDSRALADDLLDAALGKSALHGPDRALATELFYGCLRHRRLLDRVASWLAPQPPRGRTALLLHLGLYQLLLLERIPPHAAVHETVELAKAQATPPEARFLNATLRRTVREREALRGRIAAMATTDPAVFHSHPDWLFDRWERHWGRSGAMALCAWNNQAAAVYARRNTLRAPATPGAADAPGLGPPHPAHPLAYRVDNPAALLASPAFAHGDFYLQDPSTLMAVDLLDPQPGESVLDMCAAPGGKTTYLAQKMANRGRIIAADSVNARLGLVAENCRRLGVEIVALVPCEGTRLDRCLRGEQFDRVLLDAPCSNTGVMRRRPDLRWRLEAEEIGRLATLQGRLLAAAAAFVRPGGTLVYSTCSLEPEENEQVADAFTRGQAAFQPATARALFPPRDGIDGAFVARWRRGAAGLSS